MKRPTCLLCLFFLKAFSFVIEEKLDLAVGLEQLNSGVVFGNYGFFGTSTKPGYIIKVDLSNNTRVGYISLNSGENYLGSSFLHGDCGYFSATSGQLVKVNLTSFTRVGSINILSYTSLVYGNHAYLGGAGNLHKVNLDTFSYNSSINVGGSVLYQSILYSFYGYFASNDGYIIKVNLANWTMIGSLSLVSDGTQCTCSAVYGNRGFFGYNYTPKLVQVNLDTMTRISSLLIPDVTITVVNVIGQYGFVGGAHSTMVDFSTFTLVSSNTDLLPLSPSGYSTCSAISYNNSTYFGLTSSPGAIVAINSSNLVSTRIYVDEFEVYLNLAFCYNGYLYYIAGRHLFPIRLVKTDPITMTHIDTLIIKEYTLTSTFLYGDYAYFTDPTGYLVEVDLVNFNRTSAYYIGGYLACSVISDNIAYLGASDTTKIYKFNMTSKNVVESLVVSNSMQKMAIIGGYLYVGAYSTVVKVDLSTFTVVNTLSTGATSGLNSMDSYAYFVSISSIYQVYLFTFSTTNYVSQGAETYLCSVFYNSSLYIGTASGLVIEYQLPSLSKGKTIDLNTTYVQSMTVFQDYIYAVAFEATGAAFKINMLTDQITTVSTTSSSSSTSSISSASTSTSSTSISTTSSSTSSTSSSTSASSTFDVSTSSTTSVLISTSALSNKSEIVPPVSSSKSNSSIYIGVVVGLVGIILLGGIVIGFILYRRKRNARGNENIELATLPLLSSITKVGELGKGNFGQVWKGSWKGSPVALKALKENSDDYRAFVKECNVLSQLLHPNIVQFLGVYKDDEKQQFLVTEFMAHGDLLSLVRTTPEIGLPTMIDMSLQAASGMSYLHSKNIIHRDLALRNLLVTMSGNKYIIKVADFGMSSILKDAPVYYQEQRPGVLIPVKWTAPEVLKFGKVTTASDVWSFGICLWELFSKGETPYAGIAAHEILNHLNYGYRLPQPRNCPKDIYEIMLDCWKENYEERPSFDSILQKFPKEVNEEKQKQSRLFASIVHEDNYNDV